MLMHSFVRYMNRDGKRFENLDQILRHLLSLGQHEDEIVKVRFISNLQISHKSLGTAAEQNYRNIWEFFPNGGPPLPFWETLVEEEEKIG